MNDSDERFREIALHAVHVVEESCSEFNLQNLAKVGKSVKRFINEQRYLDIAVLGQFKAGKSSFLNAILGQPVLPVGCIPVTSVITRIVAGDAERALIEFDNGNAQAIAVGDLADYVTESANPENVKGVVFADVELAGLKKCPQARLIDTPGIGSIWKHNTETVLGWFPETGAVLFVMSAERPISDAELRLLEDVLHYSPQLFIVITKIDLFPEKQVREIIDFTRVALKKNLGREFPVYPFSTVTDTSKHIQVIENKVLVPLMTNVVELRQSIAEQKVASLIKACLSYLDIAYQASVAERGELEKLKKAILDEHMNAHYARRELLHIIESYKQDTRTALLTYMKTYEKPIIDRLSANFFQSWPGWKGNLNRFSRRYEVWLRESLTDEIKQLLLTEEKSFQIINGAKKHLSFYLSSFRKRLNENIRKSLGIEMQSEDWGGLEFKVSRPSIATGRSFDFHLDMLWFLFPMFMFRRIFVRFFVRQIPGEVDKNIHRLTSDLTGKVFKEMDRMMEQAISYIRYELELIESLLAQKPDTAGRTVEIREKLETLLQSVNSNRRNMDQ